jgi:uncharacterized protein DUF6338
VDVGKILEALAKPEGIIAFLVLIAPGFVAIRTIELRISGEQRKASDAIIDILLFSIVTDLIWGVILHAFRIEQWTSLSLWLLLPGLIAFVFLTPIGLVFAYVAGRKMLARPGVAMDMEPKPWGWVFNEYLQEPVQIVLTLTDGRRVGGLWQDPSYASGYPADEQIFFSEVYSVDGATGELIAPIPHHRGILVDKTIIEYVEFFDADRPFAQPKAASAKEPKP